MNADDPCPNCQREDCDGCTTGYTDSMRDRDADMRVEWWWAMRAKLDKKILAAQFIARAIDEAWTDT